MKRSFTLERHGSHRGVNQLRENIAIARLQRPMKIVELSELGLISIALIGSFLGVDALMHW